ncbi:stalk domain-containing protein [Paenibacillus sp. GCM10027626]|uniref:copper amine oxidase N-terminal domain-containing protein n=1 Tax=Paenibacillus sp. GCM10027626 TaxID=3273411 RepID=UPI00362B96B3
MKSLKWLLMLSLLILPLGGSFSPTAFAEEIITDKLELQLDSTAMVHNGWGFQTPQPATVKKGTTFVPFASLATRYGYKVTYDSKSKESIAINEQLTGNKREIRFKLDSTLVKQGSNIVKAPAAPFAVKGTLMVPVRTWANVTDSKLSIKGKTISLSWNSLPPAPTAEFTVSPSKIYAGETMVTYTDRSKSPSGARIINEAWEGKLSVFPEAGQYTITRQVQDANGTWSEPYSVTIDVLAPNLPPVADFTTDKLQYRIGERIEYTDLSTDDGNAIVKRTWTPKLKDVQVFFEPGEHQVTLEVEDKQGLKDKITKTIFVTDEVLYTRAEYDMLYTAVGDKFAMASSKALSFPALKYSIESDRAKFVRSNSPETLTKEGIVYEDVLSGDVRFLFHNLNNSGYSLKMYLIVTNPNSTTATVSTGAFGLGGPNQFVGNTGKLSTVRYLKSLMEKPAPKWFTLKPGESISLMPELSQFPIKPKQVISAYGDVFSEKELQYRVVVVKEDRDPIKSLPDLSILERDVHVRGTFSSANRTIEVNEPLGYDGDRIVLGDYNYDSYLVGYDATSGQNEVNVGNFGVVYKLKLNRVAPNTLIVLNPRAGHYTGGFIVNGELVTLTNDSILNLGDAGVLYRTGNQEESVEMVFTLATGSNLAVAMLLMPMPEERY